MAEKKVNKITSKLTEAEKQELYKNARTSDWYDSIWKDVGKCVFCDLNDKYIIHEENDVVLTISLYPYIDGHMMIIPRAHIKSPKDFSDKQWETVRKFIYLAKKMIRKVHNIKSMQIVYKDGVEAQGTVNGHLHFHCIPFDSADLSVWNYRTLKDTPLDNSNKYKSIAKKISKYDQKFQEKYNNKTMLPIVCDLIIINKDNKVLFEVRKDEYKFDPDIIVLPGGHIDIDHKTLEEELIREVEEEIGIKFEAKDISLVSSKLSDLNRKVKSKYSNENFIKNMHFIRNTYATYNFNNMNKIQCKDDCESIVWLSAKEIKKHEKISDESKDIILKILKSNGNS